MVWLKRLHGWIGMWGAIVGLIIGITGITLNHRAAIGAGQANEVTRFQLEIPQNSIAAQSEFELYVKENLGFSSDPVVGMGGGMAAANALSTRCQSTSERYDISWVPGNQFATVTHTESGVANFHRDYRSASVEQNGWVCLAGDDLVFQLSSRRILFCCRNLSCWSFQRNWGNFYVIR